MERDLVPSGFSDQMDVLGVSGTKRLHPNAFQPSVSSGSDQPTTTKRLSNACIRTRNQIIHPVFELAAPQNALASFGATRLTEGPFNLSLNVVAQAAEKIGVGTL